MPFRNPNGRGLSDSVWSVNGEQETGEKVATLSTGFPKMNLTLRKTED